MNDQQEFGQLRHARVRVSLGHGEPVRRAFEPIFASARILQRDEMVARHLVGASLERRFSDRPELVRVARAASATNAAGGDAGDFRIRDTVFYVTVRPTDALIEKYAANANAGLTVVVLVPDAKLQAARELASQAECDHPIVVESIESFVGQNISELGEYGHESTRREFIALIETYNRRVESVETDRSMLIEAPEAVGSDG